MADIDGDDETLEPEPTEDDRMWAEFGAALGYVRAALPAIQKLAETVPGLSRAVARDVVAKQLAKIAEETERNVTAMAFERRWSRPVRRRALRMLKQLRTELAAVEREICGKGAT